MKKIYSVLVIMCMCLVVFACGKQPTISYSVSELTVNMGSDYTLDNDKVKINNSSSGYEVKVLDTTIAEIEGLKITPKSVGETKIVISLISNSAVKFEIKLTVTNIVYASNPTIEKEEIELNTIKEPTVINKITLNAGCNEVPMVEITPSGIVEYDYVTGVVTAKSAGSATVVVYYRNCNVGFRVNVTDVVYATMMSVENNTVMIGSSGLIDFECYPQYANTYKFFTNSDVITLDNLGNYTAEKLGTADVFYEYIKEENGVPIVGTFKVNVIEKIESFECEILDENYNEPEFYLIEKSYKLVVDLNENILPKQLKISNNISFADIKHFEYIEDIGWVANINFNRYTDNEIIVSYQYGEGANNVITHTVDLYVYGHKDFRVQAPVNGWDLRVSGSDMIVYNLSDHNNNPIYFYWSLAGKRMYNYAMTVYYEVGDNKIYLNNNSYLPIEVGEILLHFELNGVLKESLVVVAQ